jgi:hypothetical protein
MAFTIRLSKDNYSTKARDIVASLRGYLSESRFIVDGITLKETRKSDTITLGKVRLKIAKDFCGNHPLPCPVRPGPHKPHKVMTLLEGADWVAFNDMLNDILDLYAADANAGSSHVIIRKGVMRCVEYTAQQLGNGIDNEWVKDSGKFANCIGRKMRAKYPEGTPGFPHYMMGDGPDTYEHHDH